MAGSRLRPSGCGIDARPRASEHRILLEQPGDHCGVEIGAITVVEPHPVLGGSARMEFDYGLVVLDDEMLDAELRKRTESCAGCWSPLLCSSYPGPIRARRRVCSKRSANPLRQSASRIRSLHRQRAARAWIADPISTTWPSSTRVFFWRLNTLRRVAILVFLFSSVTFFFAMSLLRFSILVLR